MNFNEFQFDTFRSIEDLVFALINEIGLGINQNGLVFDIDNGQFLLLNGRQIKASVDVNHPIFPNDMHIVFDPVFDNKLMSFILGYYLKKEEAMGNIDPLSISEDFEPIPYYYKDYGIKTRKSRVSVVLLNRPILHSIYYYQKGLKYSDMILRIGGRDNIDLKLFDSLPEEYISAIPLGTNIYPKDEDNYY